MYEFTLTNSVNDAVQRLCRQTGWRKIRRIMVKIGGMRKVNPELMAFIFAAVSKDTPAEGALLSVMLLPVTVKCHSCGKVSAREESDFVCPLCGSKNVQILSGLELNIEAIEVESSNYE
ncbi:MAG: hydrogenase maturation nickel metallochaperone HypA [Synergistaceae bacterium]|nr:hydrogenase maturation nickel metallochaperone HypA [Synergistaceae bacterium]MBQ6113273.1 hydrogenase maturation nickel metallochaperone HypA [Synergistaceae bacterium]MBQ6969292.1 hydrogenase maturation nickel metallochaperone HypA [Synergistaceae bacterium]